MLHTYLNISEESQNQRICQIKFYTNISVFMDVQYRYYAGDKPPSYEMVDIRAYIWDKKLIFAYRATVSGSSLHIILQV